MANEKQLEILKKGVTAWNRYRKNNPLEQIDLSGAKLRGANLGGINLINADLEGADLIMANLGKALLRGANLSRVFMNRANFERTDLSNATLKKADLRKADLGRANLRGADLSGSDLRAVNLSGTIIDKSTLKRTKKIKGGQVGINGIWIEATDSAALMTFIPQGNCTDGVNPALLIKVLKLSRRMLALSMILAIIIIVMAFLGIDDLKAWSLGIDIPGGRLGLVAMFLSLCLLYLGASGMADALKGTRCLHDRETGMMVGNFRWVLTRYAKNGPEDRIRSIVLRLISSFHPLVYLYFLNRWGGDWEVPEITIFGILLLLLLILSGKIFLISQDFQRPILFDRKTEEARQDNISLLTRLTKALEAQTASITNLISMLRPKNR